MKHTILIGLLALPVILFSCKDDVMSAGSAARMEDEEVRVHSAVYGNISSQTDTLADFAISQTPDSFLLGYFNAKSTTSGQDLAVISCDLLTQFACPEGFAYPDSCEVDSVSLLMTYQSWFGDGYSPLTISVYEMDRATFDYGKRYTCNEDLSLYWSGEDSTHVVLEDRTVVAALPSDSIQISSSSGKYVPYIKFKMNDHFVQKMRSMKRFPSQEKFNEDYLKGLYITTTQGKSTVLYVSNVTMIVHYHYYYKRGDEGYIRATDTKYLYANKEVRQVNRYSYPERASVLAQLQQEGDSLNYMITPGYMYTSLSIPMAQYVDSIYSKMTLKNGDTLQSYVNKALMKVDVAAFDSTTFAGFTTPAQSVLLIKRDSVDAFFKRNGVPALTAGGWGVGYLIGVLDRTIDSQRVSHYYYTFDLSTMLQTELRKKTHNKTEEMVMMPVNVVYSSTSIATIISQVKMDQTISSTILYSAKSQQHPINIDVVFSGFSINSIH